MQRHYFESIKWIFASLVALGVGTMPLNPSTTLSFLGKGGFGGVAAYAQDENSVQQVEQLLQQAVQHTQQGQHQKAVETLQQLLTIARQLQIKDLEGIALAGIGHNYNAIGQPQPALDAYVQALMIFREIKNRGGEATTLSNIGAVYDAIGQPSEALKYYQQVLPIFREVQDRSEEATTLNNMAAAYRDTNNPTEAINHLEKSLECIELVITAELANYNRLVNAKVDDPEVQATLDAWNQKNEQLEFQRQQLQENFSEELSRQIRQLEAEVYSEAETLGKKYPSIAELFETTPTDIDQLRCNIPQGTLVLHLVLLTNIQNVPDTVVLFLLTQDSFEVVKHSIDGKMLDSLIDDYYQQLKNPFNPEFLTTNQQLYDLLIRPIEDEIAAKSPETLAIIASNKLRHIPFGALHDGAQYLISKYPIYELRTDSYFQSFSEGKSGQKSP